MQREPGHIVVTIGTTPAATTSFASTIGTTSLLIVVAGIVQYVKG